MKKWIILIVVLGLVGWAIFDFTGNSSTEESKPPTEDEGLGFGEIAPNIKLNTLSGEEVNLHELRGEPVMVNFWATWCPPCRAEMPDMQKFYEETDAEILAVNATDSESKESDITDFVDEFELTIPILLDPTGGTTESYGAYSLPTTYFINSEGEIHFKLTGPMNYDLMKSKFEEMK